MATFVVYVRRTSEVLGRIVLLFHRRAMDIERLTAERATDPRVVRMTIEVETDLEQTRLIEANLYKLVDVFFVARGGCHGPVFFSDLPG
jgi:acetolactate synthase I/III small subunit